MHAPRVGCDRNCRKWLGERTGFNPRTPGGVRHNIYNSYLCNMSFNPRTPGGVRRDLTITAEAWRGFNPRTPGGVRHYTIRVDLIDVEFQSTHPGRGATSESAVEITSLICFNPRTPGGVRPSVPKSKPKKLRFNPRTPGGVRLYKKERAESQGNMWYVLRTYWCGFPLNKLSDFSFKLSS